MRVCIVFGVSLEHGAVEEATAEVLLRLIVWDRSLLLRLAIGTRLVFAFGHVSEQLIVGVKRLAFCQLGRNLLKINFPRQEAPSIADLSHHNSSTPNVRMRGKTLFCMRLRFWRRHKAQRSPIFGNLRLHEAPVSINELLARTAVCTK